MATEPPVLLLVSDRPVLPSLQFSLAVEDFLVADRAAAGSDQRGAATLIVDQAYSGDDLFSRSARWAAPTILLATNPTGGCLT